MTTSPSSSSSSSPSSPSSPSAPSGARERRLLPGSERLALDAPAAELADGARAQVTLVLRRRAELPEGVRVETADLGTTYGAAPDDVALVTRVLEGERITVVEAHAPSRRVRIEAPVSVLEDVFGTTLHGATLDGTDVRAREGSLPMRRSLSPSL